MEGAHAEETEADELTQRAKPVGRPRLNENGGRKPLKRKVGSYTNQLKLDAATHLEKHNDTKISVLLKVPEGATSVAQPADVAKWIAQGWEMLTPSAISNGFKKCGYPYVDSRQMATAVEDDNFANDVIAELHNLHIVDESYGDIDSDADFDRPGLESETSTANQ
ncbi:hypothetical protein GN244_ATG00759 [Phytophthora infestans]|uniref:DDE-1 domain-containing protein n=1 Tax=Phytophthora infestans TaxID=4787 RepID=A0A833WQD6_PHYIN|nr:hypothetical protein GN244_ATG00759 [Phytophthora infestans]KAF4130457.1 hypothetical protein GN958_ATG20351 [Phytophthora infestans]